MIIYDMHLKGRAWQQDEWNYLVTPENDETEECMMNALKKHKQVKGNVKIEKLKFFVAEGITVHQYVAICDSGARYLLEFMSK